MDSALAWFGQLVEWVGKFFPRWTVITSTDGAVKFESFFLARRLRVLCGGFDGHMRLTVLGPGLHWWWPATTSFQEWPVAFQSDDLKSQTMETSDGVGITVAGMISYRIVDLGKLLPYTHSAVKTIQVVTLAAIHSACCRMDWETLKVEQQKGTLNTKLRNAAQKPLTEFGIVVDDCMLTDLVRSKALRLIQSTQRDDD